MYYLRFFQALVIGLCAVFLAVPVSAQNVGPECIVKANHRLEDPNKPLPPNWHLLDLRNNCGVCVNITTNTFRNGSPTGLAMTFNNVGPGQVKTDKYYTEGVGTYEQNVTNVQKC